MLDLCGSRPSIIGMVHLMPLPGSPRFCGALDTVDAFAVRDAIALERGGVDAIMIENFGDAPFTRGRVSGITVAAMTRCALAVRKAVTVPIGINVLRNDVCRALEIAAVVGASFVRVNVLIGSRVTDQGLIEGDAHKVMRRRAELGLSQTVQVWADVDVKHSSPLAPRPFGEEIRETVGRGLADAIVISGAGTGSAVSPSRLKEATAAATAPVLLGSGVTAESIRSYRGIAGAIVGSFLKEDSLDSPVSEAKVAELMNAVRSLQNAKIL
ncbi:MAG: membrane complex biogenesis BtpA family protein [Bradymonadia bacterium]|jgi:membrane complex biogenesis BtpA family protein